MPSPWQLLLYFPRRPVSRREGICRRHRAIALFTKNFRECVIARLTPSGFTKSHAVTLSFPFELTVQLHAKHPPQSNLTSARKGAIALLKNNIFFQTLQLHAYACGR